MVAAPVVEGKLSCAFMLKDDLAAFLESAEGKAAKRSLFAFRIWCVVELHSALEFGVPIVIRAGTAVRNGDQVTYNTDGAVTMLDNLSYMIDVEKAECAVQADYDREIMHVRAGVGADTVNKRVAGVVRGGMVSAGYDILEVDAAVCGEPEALRALPDDRVEDALGAAAAGGRLAAVEVLLARGVVDLSSKYYPLFIASSGGHLEVVQARRAARPRGAWQARRRAAVAGTGSRTRALKPQTLKPQTRTRPAGALAARGAAARRAAARRAAARRAAAARVAARD